MHLSIWKMQMAKVFYPTKNGKDCIFPIKMSSNCVKNGFKLMKDIFQVGDLFKIVDKSLGRCLQNKRESNFFLPSKQMMMMQKSLCMTIGKIMLAHHSKQILFYFLSISRSLSRFMASNVIQNLWIDLWCIKIYKAVKSEYRNSAFWSHQ